MRVCLSAWAWHRGRGRTQVPRQRHKYRQRHSHRRQSTPLRSMQPGRPRLRELGSMELTASSRRRILSARCSFGKGAAGFARDGDRDRDAGESSRRVTCRSPIRGRRVLGARLLARQLLRVERERTRRLLRVQHTRTRGTRSSSRRW